MFKIAYLVQKLCNVLHQHGIGDHQTEVKINRRLQAGFQGEVSKLDGAHGLQVQEDILQQLGTHLDAQKEVEQMS